MPLTLVASSTDTHGKEKNIQLREIGISLETLGKVRSNTILDVTTKEAQLKARNTIETILAKTNITANLLDGDYQACLRQVAPIFNNADRVMSDLPFQAMLIVLLARLKKRSSLRGNVSYTHGSEILNQMVDSFITRQGDSIGDATSILSEFGSKIKTA